MDKHPVISYKTLVIGIILLFTITNITTSIAVETVKKYTVPTPLTNTLYVGGTGPDNYTKIQDAIDNVSNGGTIFVYTGTYYENVYVHKKINLIGENKYTTIIDGMNDDVLTFGSDNVNISGFTIHNNYPAKDYIGINVMWHSNNIIRGNIINNMSIGLNIQKSFNGLGTNNFITKNTITNNDIGISIDGKGFSGNINNNIITKNIITNSNISIRLIWADQHTIRGNNITNNNDGITLSRSDQNNISNNNITKNNDGVILDHSEHNTIKNNNITNNLNIGLKTIKSGTNSINYNNFIGNKNNAYFKTIWIYKPFLSVIINKWDSNYWDNWIGIGPKIIFGSVGRLGIIPCIQLDWHPAKEPYDI